MSDLHDLANPTEETPEDIAKVEIKKQQVEKAKSQEDLKLLYKNFKQKYLKKLFLALGIAVTASIFLIWILSKLFSPDTVIAPESVTEIAEEVPQTQESTVKYRKFDGHQYFFYVPESYGFLNRTRNDDLNEVVFSDDKLDNVFILQEFEADNDNEETLDSIYAYVATTVPPKEKTEVEINGNKFKRRVYEECLNEASNSASSDTSCINGIWYTTYLNGLVIIFYTSQETSKIVEENILSTFTKNVVDKSALTDDYIKSALSSIKNKLQARYKFGTPIKTEERENVTQLTWRASNENELVMDFNISKVPVSANGSFDYGLSYDLMNSGELNGLIANAIYIEFTKETDILKKNPKAVIYVDDHIPNDNYWEIAVNDPASEINIGNYKSRKDTYDISSAE